MNDLFKRWFSALFASGFMLLLARPVPAKPAGPEDIKRITARGELIVAMPSFDDPPFFYQHAGTMQGVDVELAQGLAEALHVQLRIDRRPASFNAAVDLVAGGEADAAVCKLSRTLPRAARVRFSNPYLSLNHAMAINRLAFAQLAHGRDFESVIRHFTGTIGVIEQSSFAEFAARNFPEAKVVPFHDWKAVVAAVERGQITAAYRDEFEIQRLLQEDPRSSLALRTVTFSDVQDSLAVAVPSDSYQLLAVVNLYLDQQPVKLTVARVLERLKETRP